MKTQQLQIVNFEQAKRLKEAGFDWYSDYVYLRGEIKRKISISNKEILDRDYEQAAPTVALALKWFRDEKSVYHGIYSTICEFEKDRWAAVYADICFCDSEIKTYETYESAESALLDELLTLIEKQ